MAKPLRHRQTKEAETDMHSLTQPRHIPTLPWQRVAEAAPGTQIGTMLHCTDEVCFALTEPWPGQRALTLIPTALEGSSAISRAAARSQFLSLKQRPIQFNDREGGNPGQLRCTRGGAFL